MIDFDELRKEVAVTHNVLLGKDDPILVTLTLHDLVLRRYVEVLSAQNEGHTKALSAALQAQVEASKEIGGRVITDAAEYVGARVQKSVDDALSEAVSKVRAELDTVNAAKRESAAEAANARSARTTAILAAIVAGACAVIAVAAVVIVMLK